MKLEDWSRWSEIVASVAVVASLLFLTIQVGENTRALERQAINERSDALNEPYINGSRIPALLAKVKEVDGPEPGEQAFVDRYRMSYEEAAIFGRYVSRIWTGIEADYIFDGESDALRERIQLLFLFPDIQLFWDTGAPQVSDPGFREYVAKVRALPNSKAVNEYSEALENLK